MSVSELQFSAKIRIFKYNFNHKLAICIFNIILTVHHDKLYSKTNRVHFHEFYCYDNLYIFLISKLFIFKGQFYCTYSLWYVSW